MLKKLFIIIIISTGTIFSSEHDFGEPQESKSSTEINRAILQITKDHLRIDGRRVDSLYVPRTVKIYSKEDPALVKMLYSEKDNYCNNNQLRLCQLIERSKRMDYLSEEPIILFVHLSHTYPNNEDIDIGFIPDFDCIAIDPIYSQSKTVASSDLHLQQAVNILKGMLCVINGRREQELAHSYSPLVNIYYDPIIKILVKRHGQINIITPQFGKASSVMPVPDVQALTIDDILDDENLERLFKSELFVAQVYTELLKKRPKEVDGVKIIYRSDLFSGYKKSGMVRMHGKIGM